MNKAIGLFLMLFGTSAWAMNECKDISSYVITSPVSFHKQKLGDAVGKLISGMPLTVKSEDTTGMVVSGKNVSGPLDQVLKSMADSAKFTVRQDGCQITVTPVDKDGKPITPTWVISKGETLSAVLERWTKASGWALAYEVEGKIVLGGDLSFDGEFEGSVDSLLNVIKNSSGVEVMHKFYYGNRSLRIYRSALVESNNPIMNRKEK